MAWSNQPPILDITLPSGGSLTPGSSTVYIGGPSLPAALTAALGTSFAILWYTDAATYASTNIEYYFLSWGTDSLTRAQVVTGYYHTVNGIAKEHQVGYQSVSYVGLQVPYWYVMVNENDAATKGMLFNASGPNPYVDFGMPFDATKTARLWLTNTPYLTIFGGVFDTWITSSIGPIATLGTTYTATSDVRITFDRVVDLRARLTFAISPTGQNFTTPVGLVPTAGLPDTSPTGLSVQASAAWLLASTVRTPVPCFINNSGQLLFRGPTATSPTSTQLDVMATWTVLKA